jgi:predicted amidophosphoribosyltransferase
LIPKRQVNHRKDVTYFTVKTWKKPIKDAQLSALRALKEFGYDELAVLAADDVKSALEGLLGTLDFDFVTSIPCMHSKRATCFSNLIGQKISLLTGIPFKECFKREYRAGSSHPANNPRLPPFRLAKPVHGKILLIDDVATSGTHIEKAAKRLRENGSSVFCVAWIGDT